MRGWMGRMTGGLLAVALTLFSVAGWAVEPNDRVDLRVLVLGATGWEASLEAWTAALKREGVPFDVIIANDAEPITAETLTNGEGHARYQAVVFATGGLLDCTAGCISALAAPEWEALDAYQVRYGIRRVVAYTYPTPDYGLEWPFFAGDATGTTTQVTEAGKAVFTTLAGPVPIDVGSWTYLASPLPDTNFEILVQGPDAPNGLPSSLVGVHTRDDGIEELVVTLDTNPHQVHSMLLAHGMIEWATKGIHLGYNRNYFMAHIDDVFLPDDVWNMEDNVTYEDPETYFTAHPDSPYPTVRMVPSDVDRAIAWQNATGLVLDMVFNGGGSVEAIAIDGSDPLTTRLLQAKSDFRWINHTYEHPNLDTMTQAEIVAQIKKNVSWAKKVGIPINARELVTGEHSGLKNPAMPAALSQAGIRWIGADNSREPTPYAIGPAMTIPRHPANVYYNVGTLAEQLDEYNWIYFENCVNTATHTCRSTMATYAEYVDSEATIMLRHLLTNDPRPHYFHQSNLAEDGTLYPVLDEVIARYAAYFTVPLLQPVFAESSTLLLDQMAWQANQDADAASQVQAYTQNGQIKIYSPTTIKVPVTGAATGSWYGGERAGWLTVKGGSTKKLAPAIP